MDEKLKILVGLALSLLVLGACASNAGQETVISVEAPEPTNTIQPAQTTPNDSSFERDFSTTSHEDDVLIGAYFYPWYDGTRHVHWENHPYLSTPLLGEYTSRDELVINQQIDWAAGHGVDFFIASWWGRFDPTDSAIKAFSQAELADEIQFTIIYESFGLLLVDTNGEIDLSNPINKEQLVSDFSYLATTFFQNPNYLTVDGKPVVVLYLSRIFVGNITEAFDAARAAVKDATGQDVFILGDEVWWQEPEESRLSLYDGITGYIMHSWDQAILDNFNAEVEAHYEKWAQAAQSAGIYFVPGVIPGFDDRGYDPISITPPIPRSLELFEAQLRTGLSMASGDLPMILITSWNEWHEDTTIEPAETYGFTYLDVLQSVLDER